MGFVPRLMLATLTVMATAAPAFAQAGSGVKVVEVREQLRGAIAPNPSWTSVTPGSEVMAGDTLKTGPGAAADLLMTSGAHLVMGENTLIRLQSYDGAVSPRMLTGRARFVAPPAGTTSMIAGDFYVSGTDAEAVIERQGGTWNVAVISGRFRVGDGRAFLQVVEAGKLLSVPTDGAAAQVADMSRSRMQDLQEGLRFGAPAPAARPTAQATPRAVAAAAGPNRWVATGLSTLLPGAGQLYAGELPRGLTYLGLNGALLGVGYYARTSGQNNLALAMGLSLLGLNLVSPLDALIFTPESQSADAK